LALHKKLVKVFSALFVFDRWKIRFCDSFFDVVSSFLEGTVELVEAQESERIGSGRNTDTLLGTCKWRE